mmetsp:Transcript_50017/g.60396  ORF Transcript_50017/g.60396 Transcript_50017/m.60396 type:complete len:142 (-) Transcript_50017:336-761(-)
MNRATKILTRLQAQSPLTHRRQTVMTHFGKIATPHQYKRLRRCKRNGAAVDEILLISRHTCMKISPTMTSCRYYECRSTTASNSSQNANTCLSTEINHYELSPKVARWSPRNRHCSKASHLRYNTGQRRSAATYNVAICDG